VRRHPAALLVEGSLDRGRGERLTIGEALAAADVDLQCALVLPAVAAHGGRPDLALRVDVYKLLDRVVGDVEPVERAGVDDADRSDRLLGPGS
jgi:hypothetical protein